MAIRRLGKGLDALIPQRVVEAGERVSEIDISKITPNPDQPRKHFDHEALQELAQSIKEYGVLQPLVVTRQGDGYQIIAGERRYQASKLAGLAKLPVIVRDYNTQVQLEIALVENIQREDLSPLEEARGYKRLKDEFDLQLKDIADKVGKQFSTISNKMRLLLLPKSVQEGLSAGKITEGHARALLALPQPELMELAYAQILRDSLSVRQVEALVNQNKPARTSTSRAARQSTAFMGETRVLQDKFQTKVKISERQGKGSIALAFYSHEELTRLLDLLQTIGE